MRRSFLNKPQASPAAAAAASAPTLAIESMTIDQVLTGRRILSVEEEVVELAAADELQNTVTQDVAETARVEDVTDVMLNMADTMENVPVMTADQAKLIDTATEMAVAGSDGDPDTVYASVAPVVGDPVATEGFADNVRKRAAEIWERIRAFCVQIWKSIVEFFKRIFNAAPRLLARVKTLRDLVAEKKKAGAKSPSQGTIAVHVGANSISYPGYIVKNATELNKGLGELKGLATYAFGNYMKDIKSQAEFVATELNKFNPKEAAASLKTVAVGLQKNNFTNLPHNPPTGYLGCFDVVSQKLDKNKTKDLSDAQIVAALRNSRVHLQNRAGNAPTLNMREGFVTMTIQEMESTLTAVEGLVKQVIAHEGSADSKAIDKARDDLVKGGNHAAKACGDLQGADPAADAERNYAIDVMRSLANFNTTLTRWVSDLPMPVTKKIYQTSRTSLVLVEKSLAKY